MWGEQYLEDEGGMLLVRIYCLKKYFQLEKEREGVNLRENKEHCYVRGARGLKGKENDVIIL